MFTVQVGRYRNKYRTRYSFSDKARAEFHYACLNIHSGYKKRLLDSEGKVIARFISS